MQVKHRVFLVLRKMFEADWNYGTGFYGQKEWRDAYDELFRITYGVDRDKLNPDDKPLDAAFSLRRL